MVTQCILVYASMTGNTETMAEAIAEGAQQAGIHVNLQEMLFAKAADLQRYDAILIGSYTWGDGDLPDEAEDFYKEMKELQLQQKKAAVFGSCDSNYVDYGAAVDLFEERLRKLGADIVQPGLKVDRTPNPRDLETCMHFGKSFALSLL